MEAPTTRARARLAPEAGVDPLRTRLALARFEALAEYGVPLADARAIAHAVDVDIVEVVGLLRHGCPADLVLPILA
jgi:hypothetical protein